MNVIYHSSAFDNFRCLPLSSATVYSENSRFFWPPLESDAILWGRWTNSLQLGMNRSLATDILWYIFGCFSTLFLTSSECTSHFQFFFIVDDVFKRWALWTCSKHRRKRLSIGPLNFLRESDEHLTKHALIRLDYCRTGAQVSHKLSSLLIDIVKFLYD